MPKPFYIIGPVSGHKDRNQPAFEQARLRLEKATNSMCDIPHDLIPEEASWETAMLISINKLTGRSFPSMAPTFRIALLPGWEDSRGASFEKKVADNCGIPCKTVDEWIEEAERAALKEAN